MSAAERLVIAVPNHVGGVARRHASPGLLFGMYTDVWDWTTDGSIAVSDERANAALADTLTLDDDHRKLCEALVARQALLAEGGGEENLFALDALATAPFATGLGNAHPTDNGFTFSMPHGLPYLPGSGVKGVLRAAARELVDEKPGPGGWSEPMIDVLFGGASSDVDEDGENGEKRRAEAGARGALSFLDVLPVPAGNAPLLELDVMTPHHSHYLAGEATPHDYGQPNPILFVTVAPGTRFAFHVLCDRALLSARAAEAGLGGELGGEGWKEPLRDVFEHAFDWLGFGAKTSVGYGAMAVDPRGAEEREERRAARRERAAKRREEHERTARREAMDDVGRLLDETLERVTAAQPTLSEVERRVRSVRECDWSDRPEERRVAAERLRAWMQENNEWVERSSKKNPAKDKRHQRTLEVMGWMDDA